MTYPEVRKALQDQRDLVERSGRKYIQDAQPLHFVAVRNVAPDGTLKDSVTVRRTTPKLRGKAAVKAAKKARRAH